ncbi:hypothetical protein EHS25_004517 [Saitozyma podzolica]|uniref:Mitochondrial thiamine pyrophosphate transporter n=1 Tax=Saitozyma podzolica TaxID=1890683 RepID=A0A427YUF3_9TREE|nr:hypothetical protein EHS25_004517 [Saitozyma podzolica]
MPHYVLSPPSSNRPLEASSLLSRISSSGSSGSTSSPHSSSPSQSQSQSTVPSPPAHPSPTPESDPSPRPVPIDCEPPESEEDDRPLTFAERVQDTMVENSMVINTFIAGGLAGATSRTVVSPLERLKIILQVQAIGPGTGVSGQAYGRIWPSLARMWKEEGFRGFMKGNGINVIRILPYSALQFTSYGGFKSLLGKWSGEETLSTPLRLAAGAGAGIVAVSATYPLDLVRARLSIATSNLAVRGAGGAGSGAVASAFTPEDAKLGILGMTKKVYRTEGGLRGLYRGCWATAVGVAPYVSLNFYIYESLRSIFLPTDTNGTSDAELAVRKLVCGGLAGAVSLLFTHPFDVVRRKLQVAGLSAVSPQYNGAVDCITKICKAEGFWKGMYRGLTPNIIKVAPSIAVSFYTFETVRDTLVRLQDVPEPDEI